MEGRLRSRAGILGPALAMAVLAACSSSPASHVPPSATATESPRWIPVTLPVNGDGRPAGADVVACAGQWFVTGAVPSGTTTRPAAWISADGQAFRPMPVAPVSVYGRVSTLYAAACRSRGTSAQLGALGAAVGGAHGNPRSATWVEADGSLQENPAPFELYGGPDAGALSRLAGGAAGWLAVGGRVGPNRRAGAAVWPSADGRGFALVDADPALMSGPGEVVEAADVAASGSGWVVVGGRTVLGGGRVGSQALLLTSADGVRWRRVVPPAPGPGEEQEWLTRISHGGPPLAAGIRGQRFVVWGLDPAGRWRRLAEFGATRGGGLPGIRSLATDGSTVVLTAFDGTDPVAWLSRDGGLGWRPVGLPVRLHGAAATLAAAAAGGRLLLLAHDGSTTSVWSAVIGR